MKPKPQYVSLVVQAFFTSIVLWFLFHRQYLATAMLSLLLFGSFLYSLSQSRKITKAHDHLLEFLNQLNYTVPVLGVALCGYESRSLAAIEIGGKVLSLDKYGRKCLIGEGLIDVYFFVYEIGDWRKIDVAVYRFNGTYHFLRCSY